MYNIYGVVQTFNLFLVEDLLLKIKPVINAMHVLPEADWQLFCEGWSPYQCKRKDIITRAGERERYLYIVIEGVQRVVYFEEYKEATLLFTYPPSFGGVLDALLMQQPSKYHYEALTPSVFLRMPFEVLEKLMATSRDIELLVRKGVTHSLSGLLTRLAEIQSFSAEEKFRSLLSRSPHILQLIPHKYIANYLGIDATNFSKLMNRVKI